MSKFQGSIVALVTPFTSGGAEIDEAALRRLVRHHLDSGTDGIVPVGTTGESPTLNDDEHRRVVELVVNEAGGQVPVIAGAGSNDPVRAAAAHRHAADAGADAALHVMGYYNRPAQEGICRHFEYVAAAADLPVVVYNVPPRTVIDIEPETLARIARLSNVVGVKDATKDLTRPLREQALIDDESFAWLSGEDGSAVGYNAQGGNGVISVTANVAPVQTRQTQALCRDGDYAGALSLQRDLMPLHEALFAEPSSAGAK